ncbi:MULTISPECIES: CDP-6-deoxy-delta-3,4-glucoseen reductase [Chromobacterium]|uniref:CDP-6-deoxy-delta-3,4-glucoseen reductase n=1 Tax=Chromobacterium TaxID=535 RepID=UPI001886C50D|nr:MULTISPECIES: CDP-6-deoxy-delta-3,4-glucoseen reductase [Chromobacterium]MDH0343291.1 CDP-6-deoxy-delta-3,4-glucoseen reductase [Chromobacterium haemolyticum]QOZ82830.1 CDP-6-deoxy-delta-3,4-glucoseen reductase [Chromobacterium sp. Rain0013]WON82900.1 CDP-6-deoxy-delta-3,4-glucoseen reductase [Chromobacterium haemolyticum]
MTAQVKVLPSGHTFGVEPHETVLEAALRQGVGLPYGCRDGACGACKGKVVDGEVSQDGFQEKALTEAERAQGLALFCCARPQGDITIEAREVAGAGDIQIKTLPCRVEKIEKIHDVAVLKLKLPVSERLQFKAGQYIDILMKDGKKRSFSIANAPHDDAFLELHIRHQPGGSFSDYVFSQMKEREIMRFKGPLGSFFLREDSYKPILFVASGTGFAPVKGIIEHAIHSGIQREMVFYWGARTKADLYMAELAGAWQAQNPNITFIPVLSDALPTDEWAGRTGFVHQAVLEDFENLSGYQVYACGAPLMVEAAHGSFTRERGLPEDEFFSDAFFLSKDMGGSK